MKCFLCNLLHCLSHQRGPGAVPVATGGRAVVAPGIGHGVAVPRGVAVEAGEGVEGGEEEGDGQDSSEEGKGEDGQEVDGDTSIGEEESRHFLRLLLYLLVLEQGQHRLWNSSLSVTTTCSS